MKSKRRLVITTGFVILALLGGLTGGVLLSGQVSGDEEDTPSPTTTTPSTTTTTTLPCVTYDTSSANRRDRECEHVGVSSENILNVVAVVRVEVRGRILCKIDGEWIDGGETPLGILDYNPAVKKKCAELSEPPVARYGFVYLDPVTRVGSYLRVSPQVDIFCIDSERGTGRQIQHHLHGHTYIEQGESLWREVLRETCEEHG